ncbi:mitochondrial import inner membrane translocase subunit TIM44-like [Gigantopelta aegis]|uniref:mitochondrial import inner membrane translocase subunit TIM44-like n=1 Tax=Gigantopelta aegis TaxID=1735272 RepID=UPI001B88A7FB|nr:mitochondrial import inner membrane translocase subunit TIM44-like [Gigantopelta aegis]
MASMCRSFGRLYRQTGHNQIFAVSSIQKITGCQCHPAVISPYQHNNGQLDFRITQNRYMSDGRKSFIQTLTDNLKHELAKNKEMKESLNKFKEETKKLEQTEAIQKARQKFTFDEVQKTDFAKRMMESTEEIGKTMGKAAENFSKQTQQLGQSSTFRSISQSVKAVKEEFDDVTLSRARHYKPPAILRMRSDFSGQKKDEKQYEANEDDTGVVLHKDSKWYQSWQNFKDNNEYVHRMFDLKAKYDESDNLMIRATRAFTDKIGYVFGGMFTKTEMSEVLTEICKCDPNFDKEHFIRMCEREIIPNILEAMIRGDLDVLKDWCHEAAFNILAQPIKQMKAASYKSVSQVIDVNNVDVVAGKIMEQGPVLVISFSAQQIMALKDVKGNVVEGNPDKIMKIIYVWALCRDQEELNPRAAWKLMDISASTSEQWL